MEFRLRMTAIAVVVGLIAIKWANIIRLPRGDFLNHWEFGRRFLSGQFIYEFGLNIPYPPFWAMAHAPLTALPVGVAQSLVFILGPIALVSVMLVVRSLCQQHEISDRRVSDQRRVWIWAGLLTVIVGSRYIMRDFDEAGPNLTLLALSWGGIWFWSRRQEWFGGLSLGLAIALKCTAAIFVLYFLWKREWRMAIMSTIAATLFSLAPVITMGPTRYAEHMQVWLTNLRGASGIVDPMQGLLGDEPVANKSLRPALGRFLVHLPAGHLARFDHPAYIDFLDLPPAVAHRLVQGGILLLVGIVGWRLRGRVVQRSSSQVAYECAAVSILALLVSPITWGQHCVATVPATLLVFHRLLSGKRMGAGVMTTALAYAVIVLCINRTFVGKELSLVLESYHFVTWSLVLLLGLVLRLKEMDRQEGERSTSPTVIPCGMAA